MSGSIMTSITTGATQEGLRIVIAGQEKIGKTTLCAGAPGVLLVPLEVGYGGVSVAKTRKIEILADFNLLLDETIYYAQKGQFPYQTLNFDSATALERLIHDHIISLDPKSAQSGKNTIIMDTAHGGYGKAFVMANNEFDRILDKLDILSKLGIHIVMTCHVFSNKVIDPTAGEYDSWDILLHSPKNLKSYGKRERLSQWADIIGFMYDPIFVSKDDSMSKALSHNKGRVLGLSRTPSYLAGNRFGISGEFPIPGPPANGWNALAEALYKSSGIDIYTR
jgi:hypothetical protein